MITLAFLSLFLLGSIVAVIFSLNALINTLRFGLPYVSTPRWAIDWLTGNLNLKSSDLVCELGCGDARVLAALAEKYPAAKFIGLEIQWWPYMLARWRTRNLPNVTVRLQNFLTADLSAVTVFYGFFITAIMPKVATKLAQHLNRGAELISFGFALPGWTEVESITNPSGKAGSGSAGKQPRGSKIRIYRK
jgi:SAM-dependent methyltransferase